MLKLAEQNYRELASLRKVFKHLGQLRDKRQISDSDMCLSNQEASLASLHCGQKQGNMLKRQPRGFNRNLVSYVRCASKNHRKLARGGLLRYDTLGFRHEDS